MNAKILITLLCATQLAPALALDISDITNQVNNVIKQATDIQQKFKDAFNQTVAKVEESVDAMKTQFQAQLQSTIQKYGNITQDISDCVKAENETVDNVVKGAKQSVQDYRTQVDSQVQPLVDQINATIAKVKAIGENATQQYQGCSSKNFLQKPICIVGVLTASGLQLTPVVQEFTAEIVQAQQVAQNLLTSAQAAGQKVIQDAQAKFQAAIQEADACIKAKIGQ